MVDTWVYLSAKFLIIEEPESKYNFWKFWIVAYISRFQIHFSE